MRSVAILVLALVVMSCGGGEQSNEETTSTTPAPDTTMPGSTAETTTTTSGPGISLPPGDQAVVEAAMEDLAQRQDVEVSEISLVSFGRVTWNDGSLGCPQPGMSYTQALVDGSKTVLELDGVSYNYHAGRDDVPFLCENPDLEPGPDPSLTVPPEDT